MGMVRRRTRRRTMLVAGGLAYERGRRAQSAQDAEYAGDDAYDDDAPPPPPAPPDPPPAGADPTSEIERLAALHDSGALTDDEFASAKAKILGL